MFLRFITADKVSGGQGFRAVWTEVKNGPGCDQFVCKNNSFCIAKHLECDGTVNCGFNDDSDEAHCNYSISITHEELFYIVVDVFIPLLHRLSLICHKFCFFGAHYSLLIAYQSNVVTAVKLCNTISFDLCASGGAVRFHSSVFALVLPLVTLLLFHR